MAAAAKIIARMWVIGGERIGSLVVAAEQPKAKVRVNPPVNAKLPLTR
jgi:hypothetical protein